MSEATNRLRVPPSKRFRDKERFFDLDEAFGRLSGQGVARNGHMQKSRTVVLSAYLP